MYDDVRPRDLGPRDTTISPFHDTVAVLAQKIWGTAPRRGSGAVPKVEFKGFDQEIFQIACRVRVFGVAQKLKQMIN